MESKKTEDKKLWT